MFFRRRKRLSARRTESLRRSKSAAEILETRALLAVFTVTTEQDSLPGDPSLPGSLRWAIEQANADPALDTIEFNLIPPLGQTDVRIQTNHALPHITQSVMVDGRTQPGFVDRPVVEIRGQADVPGSASGVNGLVLSGNEITVTGLAITRFTGSGMLVSGVSAQIIGNYIGTALGGVDDLGNMEDGIRVVNGLAHDQAPGLTTIGDSIGGLRNLISGNDRHGISIENSPDIFVMNNSIGTTADGNLPLGNTGDGIHVAGAGSFGNLLGSLGGDGNQISGNAGNGIHIEQNVPRVYVQSNLIGLDRTGNIAIANGGAGLLIQGYDAYVTQNTISGNTADGIRVVGSPLLDGVSGWFSGDDNRSILTGSAALLIPDLFETQFVNAKVGRGIRFDGIDDQVSTLFGFSQLFQPQRSSTLEFWARFDSLDGDRVLAENYMKPDGEASQGWSLLKNSENRLVLAMPGDRLISSAPRPEFTDGQFHHYAVTRSGGEISIFLDGVVVASASVAADENWAPSVFSVPRFGYRNGTPGQGGQDRVGSSMFFGGILDEVTAYEKALSQTEVLNIVQAGTAGKTKPATGSTFITNKIGTDDTGQLAVGNGANGLRLLGTAWGTQVTGNTISGNLEAGLNVKTERNRFSNRSITGGANAIGVSDDGKTALGNRDGILVEGKSDLYLTGSDFLHPGRIGIVSGNFRDGIRVLHNEGSVLLTGMHIGADVSGELALGNQRYGVFVEQTEQSYLTDVQLAKNVISGNVSGGVRVVDVRTNDLSAFNPIVRLDENLIGVSASGNHALSNGPFGIYASGIGIVDSDSFPNSLPAIWLTANTVSGNDVGVFLEDVRFEMQAVGGFQNRIGTNAAGSIGIPNRVGLLLRNGRSIAPIAGLFSGNIEAGIRIINDRAFLTEDFQRTAFAGIGFDVQVGTDATGQYPIPNGTGVEVLTEEIPNFEIIISIQGLVSGNSGRGISIDGSSTSASYIISALIGTASNAVDPLPNGMGITGGDGVFLDGANSRVEVINSTIAWNRGAGVRVAGVNSNRTSFLRNTFFGNTGLAIDLGTAGPSPNADPADLDPIDDGRVHTNAPVLESANIIDGYIEVSGTQTPLKLLNFANQPSVPIQFYATRPTPSGRGQGETRLGHRAAPDGGPTSWDPEFLTDLNPAPGEFRFRIPLEPGFDTGTLITAVVEDNLTLVQFNSGSSVPLASEFSNIIPIGSVLSSLAPIVNAGGSVQLFTGDTVQRTVSFRDEDSSAFEVLVDYGDGSGKQPLDYRRDNRTMLLDHVYQKAGNYTVTVSVLDDSTPEGNLGTDSFQVVVQNTPPEIAFNEVELTKRIREGETVTLNGTFVDLGARDAHTIEVDWGDGTPVLPESITPGTRSFALTHRYDDDGVSRADANLYRVVVTVRDEFGAASATPVFLVEVDNVLPSPPVIALDHYAIDEGGLVTLTGIFNDPGLLDTHLIYINWGDGSPNEKVQVDQIVQNGSLREFSLSHIYLDNPADGSVYTITAEVADDDDPLNPVHSTLQIEVRNLLPYFNEVGVGQPPIILSSETINEGETVAAFAFFLDQGIESHTAIVNWGDGSPEARLVLHSSDVETFLPFLSHRYLQDGVFQLSVTVSDRDTTPGNEAVAVKEITVRNVAPVLAPILVSPALPIYEGDEVVLSGSLTDPGPDDHFTVTVNWGDGTSSLADVDRANRRYTAKHRYLDDPLTANNLYSVVVSVNDGTQTTTRALSLLVQNVAPTLRVLPIVDSSTSHAVFRVVGQDVSPPDENELAYSWILTKNGVAVPFVSRSATEIQIDPATIPSGSAPLILTAAADDGDGGVTTVSSVLIVGSTGPDILTIVDSSFPSGFTSILVLGLGGDDILDASGITATGLHVILYGGEGDDLLFDGSGSDTVILGWGNDSLNLPVSDPRNTLSITPNMGGDDEIFLIPNSTLMAFDSVGLNTLNFSLAGSEITQTNGITFDLDLTVDRGTGIVAQDVAPESVEPDEHFVAALGVFRTLVGSHFGDSLTGASNSTVFGGRGADAFFTKDDITDATFGGGDDADVLTTRGVRVARIRFDGDGGPDELRVDAFGEVVGLLDFHGGDDADVFSNRGRVSRVIFDGGSDADLFQNLSGRIAKVRFDGDDGIDQFINEEFAFIEWQADDDPTLLVDQGLEFIGGGDADVFVNRGRVSRVIFDGGSDADVFQNLSGRISRVRFDGDDGPDQFLNDYSATIEWLAGDDPLLQLDAGLTFSGGDDADVFVNRGRVSRVIFDGGSDADLFRNQTGRITKVRFDGDGGSDLFINEVLAIVEWQDGDNPALLVDQGITFTGGDDADVFINRGRTSRVVFKGGADGDLMDLQTGEVVQERREDQQEHETPVPTPVEVIAGHQQHDVLQPERTARHEPIKHEHERVEKREFKRIEQHRRSVGLIRWISAPW
ncbi:MAG: hypothetical protein JNL58_23990 [Planctomyces sp.]|nr:hypothetical protein [Planctomyces sp.]